jgi:sarcosine oxidase
MESPSAATRVVLRAILDEGLTMTSARFDVAVIGAGVFGAWSAWHLQQAGRRVLLVDQYGPANTRASSGGESRVIRMAYGADAVYTHMAQRSLLQWREFFDAIGRPELFAPSGVLWMARRGQVAAESSVAALTDAGVRHTVLDAAALRQRYSQIRVPDHGWAIFEPDSGALLARRAVQAVVADACARGVELWRDQVLPLRAGDPGQCLQTQGGRQIQADQVVFACGPWLERVLPVVLGGRLFVTRQEVYYFGIPAQETRFSAQHLPTWMDFDGAWYGMPDLEARGFKLACDVHGPALDPDHAERAPTPAGIESARAFIARRFPALSGAPLLAAEVCQYENTSNGDFVIDRHPDLENVWIAGGGSGHGFKHGPAVGAYVAQLMAGDIAAEPRFSLASKSTRQSRSVH